MLELQSTPYTLALALSVVVAVVAMGLAWFQRDGPMEISGMFVQLSIALWGLFMLLTVSSVTVFWKSLWFSLFVPTIPLLIVSTCTFALYFTGRGEWLTRRRLAAFALFPAVVLLLSLTNGWHSLVLRNVAVDASGGFALLTYDLGIGFYLTVGVAYVVAAWYNALVFLKFARSRNVYRKISLVIFLTMFVMGGVTVLSLLKLSPFPHFMLLPYTNLLMGVFLVLGTGSVTFARAIPVDRILSAFSSDSSVPLARDFVVQEVDNGIVVLDGNDRVVDINATAKRMLGLDHPVGKHVLEITRPSRITDGEEVLAVLGDEDPRREIDTDVWVETSEYGDRCYQVSVSSLSDGADGSSPRVILLHDITRQKRREEQLERQKVELESQKRQLEHQNERLDRFASIVSHDLRNPLNVVDGYLEMIEADLDGGTAPVDADTLDEMTGATSRMEDIIDDALTLARQGKAITETEPVDLAAVAEDAWDNVDTGGASLSVPLDRTVDGDSNRLLNVFENLFRNAIEHNDDDVAITVGWLDDGNGFYVEDDGAGIPDESKNDVLDHGYTTSSEGTGLGLAIVKDVANAHGWDVAVADGSDGGARFEFTNVELAGRELDATPAE